MSLSSRTCVLVFASISLSGCRWTDRVEQSPFNYCGFEANEFIVAVENEEVVTCYRPECIDVELTSERSATEVRPSYTPAVARPAATFSGAISAKEIRLQSVLGTNPDMLATALRVALASVNLTIDQEPIISKDSVTFTAAPQKVDGVTVTHRVIATIQGAENIAVTVSSNGEINGTSVRLREEVPRKIFDGLTNALKVGEE